jgi:hypothetical protein
MVKVDVIGGLRLRLVGRQSKDRILENLERFLSALVEENALESFSGVNLYMQLYDESGKRLAAINSLDTKECEGLIKTIDVTDIPDGYSLHERGYSFLSVEDVQKKRKEAEQREAERKAAELLAEEKKEYEMAKERLARRAAHYAWKEEQRLLREADKKIDVDFKEAFCQLHNIEVFKEHVKSFGRIKSEFGMLKYLDKAELPNCSFIFRVTMIEGGEVRLYDNKHNLLKVVYSN